MDKDLEILKKMGIKIKVISQEEAKANTMKRCNMTEEDWEAQKESFGF